MNIIWFSLFIFISSFRFSVQKGIGIIARHHNALILAAHVESRQYIIAPITVEALAAWKMVGLCVLMEFNNVILEGDSLEVVQALRKEECTWGGYGTLINDAKCSYKEFINGVFVM